MMEQQRTQSTQDPTIQSVQRTMTGQKTQSGQQQLPTDQTSMTQDSTKQMQTILQGVQSDLKMVDRLTAWIEPNNFALLSQIPWEKYFNVEQLNIPKVKLNSGFEMPILSLTASRITGNEQVLLNSLKFAARIGYRSFNASWVDFLDPVIGLALKETLSEFKGKLTREDFFFTCKAWNTHHTREMLRLACLDTMVNVGLDYIDLYMLHWPMAFKENPGSDPWPQDENGQLLVSDTHYLEAYRAIEELVREGKVRSIGLANFNVTQLQDVLKNCKIKPAVVQVEVHPYLQNDKVIDFCQKNDIIVTAFSPLGSCEIAHLRDLPILLEDEALIKIGQKYNKTAAQVCLRWCLQRGLAPAPKGLTPLQLIENGQIFDFELSDQDMSAIKSLNKNLRFYSSPKLRNHKFYPFNEE